MDTTFDTYTFIKRLKEAGMPEQQAIVMSDTFKQVEQSRLDSLATKADVLQAKTELSGEITLLRWMVGVLIAGTVSLILKAFFIV